MATISGDLKTKFTDDLGEPLVGGKVYTYHAGTSTPKDSYQDKEFAIVNTNPIVLDDAGSCDLYLKGLYRLRVLDKDEVFVEERDYMTQGDSTGSSITDNANNITVLQSEVQAINERSVLKLDENNFIIGHGSANSATVHDPAFRVDKLKIAKKDDAESAKLLFNTYENDTAVEGETVKEGSYIDPDLITQPLVKNWRDVERAAFKGTKKDDKTNLLLKAGDSVPENSAASRLVGTSNNNLMEVGAFGIGKLSHTEYLQSSTDLRDKPSGFYGLGNGGYSGILVRQQGENGARRMAVVSFPADPAASTVGAPYYYSVDTAQGNTLNEQFSAGNYYRFYTTQNTKLDTNGAIAPSSPTVDLYSDHIETNADSERMGVKFIRNGVGNYTLKNTTGLRDEGWYIKIPNDMNGNPKVAVAIDADENGDIHVKTYKRIFSMGTFTFGPDLNEPLDIPEGRWIDLRFNDLPEEPQDEVIDEPIE